MLGPTQACYRASSGGVFKSVIAENAEYFERHCVAALTKKIAEEMKSARLAVAMARHRYRLCPYKSQNISHRRRGLVF